MFLSNDIVFKEIIKLEPVQAMRASVDPRFKYEAIDVGATTFISGILGGANAATIGSLIGGYLATGMINETIKSVPHILRNEITPEQRERLAQLVRNRLLKNDIYTLGEFRHSVTTSQALMGIIIQIVMVFLSDIGYKWSIP